VIANTRRYSCESFTHVVVSDRETWEATDLRREPTAPPAGGLGIPRLEKASSASCLIGQETMSCVTLKIEMNQQVHDSDDMRPEYDFSQDVRGKHYEAYRAGTNVVFLDPDVAKAFTNSSSVNQVLRLLLELAQRSAPSDVQPEKVGKRSSRRRTR